ncbi:MAG: thermonuclease family protein [Desulfobacteraceae bacterium]|nr:thermonuclease family protein [Desulfobacteraceae bacterium]
MIFGDTTLIRQLHGEEICRRNGFVRTLFAAWLFFGLLLCHYAACDAWTGKVVAVPEGDLLVISRDGQEKKYRLFGIDCPERGQPYWDKAQGLVGFLTEDKVVDVTPLFLGVEGFEKVLVRIEGTRDYLNQQLVAYGLAWVKVGECNSRMCSDWKKLQKMARSRSVGLWADPRPIAPWDWKRVQWKEIINGREMRRKEAR